MSNQDAQLLAIIALLMVTMLICGIIIGSFLRDRRWLRELDRLGLGKL